ncbi:MAG: sigma-54-dependent transcriptional regulator [Hyphomicrobiales bacterium]
MIKILLVENPGGSLHGCAHHLAHAGLGVTLACNGIEAENISARSSFDVIAVDLGLEDSDAAVLIRRLIGLQAHAQLIALIPERSKASAVDILRSGAHHNLVKPIDAKELIALIMRCTDWVPEEPVHDAVVETLAGFIGESEPMQSIYTSVKQVAMSQASVFVTGESGTGKEVCAEAIHHISRRASGPFVAINCGAIPAELMESEIFGHLKGAFTGAIANRDGAATQADGGTLFLDEICELDLNLQSKLLRFLQTGIIRRVGTAQVEQVDVRIICATNKNPHKEVEEGRFREDLFYRLHVIPLHMPPLRERGDDILMLAEHFLHKFAKEEDKKFETFDRQVTHALRDHKWPGNVRELQNVIRQIVVLNQANTVDLNMLPEALKESVSQMSQEHDQVGADTQHYNAFDDADLFQLADGMLGQQLWKIEQAVINGTIDACGGSIPKAAKILGISPSTIYRKRESWDELSREAA